MSKKNLIIGLIASVIIIVAFYAVRLMRWYNALEIKFPVTGLGGIKGGNLIINAEAQLINPKNFSLTVTKPTLRVSHNGTYLATSDPSDDKIQIAPNATTIIPYVIKVPLSKYLLALILVSGTDFYNKLVSGNFDKLKLGIDLDVVAYMQIYGFDRTWKQIISI